MQRSSLSERRDRRQVHVLRRGRIGRTQCRTATSAPSGCHRRLRGPRTAEVHKPGGHDHGLTGRVRDPVQQREEVVVARRDLERVDERLEQLDALEVERRRHEQQPRASAPARRARSRLVRLELEAPKLREARFVDGAHEALGPEGLELDRVRAGRGGLAARARGPPRRRPRGCCRSRRRSARARRCRAAADPHARAGGGRSARAPPRSRAARRSAVAGVLATCVPTSTASQRPAARSWKAPTSDLPAPRARASGATAIRSITRTASRGEHRKEADRRARPGRATSSRRRAARRGSCQTQSRLIAVGHRLRDRRDRGGSGCSGSCRSAISSSAWSRSGSASRASTASPRGAARSGPARRA